MPKKTPGVIKRIAIELMKDDVRGVSPERFMELERRGERAPRGDRERRRRSAITLAYWFDPDLWK